MYRQCTHLQNDTSVTSRQSLRMSNVTYNRNLPGFFVVGLPKVKTRVAGFENRLLKLNIHSP